MPGSTPVALLGGGTLVAAALGVSAALLLDPSGAAAPGGLGSSVEGHAPQASAARAGEGSPGHPITVTGTVVGQVRPGGPAVLEVTVRNDNNQPIVLTEVTGVVTAVSSGPDGGIPSCRSEWYSVGTFTGTRPVARRSSTVVPLTVALADLPSTNQDNCKGADLQLRFTARARQA